MNLVRRAFWAFALAFWTWLLQTVTVIVSFIALLISPLAQWVYNRRRRLKAPVQEKGRA